MDKFSELLLSRAQMFGQSLSLEQLGLFEKYYDSLKSYNSHTNLISNDSQEEVYIKHFLDSLAFFLVEKDIKKNFSLIDIGCGGGFPGVPILISYEQAHLSAVDSVGKKIRFLEELSAFLNLSERLSLYNKRVEDLDDDYKERFDYAVVRAVAPLGMLVEYSVPFLRVGGFLVAYKSKTAQEEIKTADKALKLLCAEVEDVKDYKISDDYTRNLIIIKKTGKSPAKYPRKNGFVKKYPI